MSYKDLYLQRAGQIISLSKKEKPAARVFGVPYDSTSSFRAGSRFAPQAIRTAFNNIEIYSKLFNIDLEEEFIEDLGDIVVANDARATAEQVFKLCRELEEDRVPVCMIGGEHSISYGSIIALPADVGVVIFDAHLDLREEFGGSRFTHATFFKRLLDELDKGRFLHIGSRAACGQEWAYVRENGLDTVGTRDFDVDKVLDNRLFRDYKKIYMSIDMDFFDPAYAPGVGNPEPCGLSPGDFLRLLSGMKENVIVGFDVVEVCPTFDNGNTSVVAAKLMAELFAYVCSKRPH
ncbi:MAG: agmatinase [Nitrososphaeria archaeon]